MPSLTQRQRTKLLALVNDYALAAYSTGVSAGQAIANEGGESDHGARKRAAKSELVRADRVRKYLDQLTE